MIALALIIAQVDPSTETFVSTSIKGGDLARDCQREAGVTALDPCNAYIWGVADGLSLARVICPPSNSWTVASGAYVRKYIREHPEDWHRSASVIVSDALISQYGCRERR